MVKIPENLTTLHDGEELVRTRSIEMIEADEDLSRHVAMIECVMDLLQFYRVSYPHDEEDTLIVKLLGARVFNHTGAAIRLMFGGYYQAAGLQIRDILETGFLIDYFTHDQGQIQRWKTVSEDERLKEFAPAKIRKVLDERDGFTEKKRQAHYKLLSNVAGHPTYGGFAMLRPEEGAEAHMGPFFVPKMLTATIQELVKVALTAWENFSWFFKPHTLEQYEAYHHYTKMSLDWTDRTYGRQSDRTHLLAVEVIIQKLREDAAEGRVR